MRKDAAARYWVPAQLVAVWSGARWRPGLAAVAAAVGSAVEQAQSGHSQGVVNLPSVGGFSPWMDGWIPQTV